MTAQEFSGCADQHELRHLPTTRIDAPPPVYLPAASFAFIYRDAESKRSSFLLCHSGACLLLLIWTFC